MSYLQTGLIMLLAYGLICAAFLLVREVQRRLDVRQRKEQRAAEWVLVQAEKIVNDHVNVNHKEELREDADDSDAVR